MTAAAQHPTSEDAPRVIAFYLPQFHPIAENDAWWGKGFTEWTNVARSLPQFPGHRQPRLPADLGFYDLRLAEAREAQAALAQEHGIHGFCYYHYWFSGRRLLNTPLDEVLRLQSPSQPFCVCWANEGWTRRWDGQDREVLLAQEYSEADDLAHIRALAPSLSDARYIRVDGRPLLLIYRTELLPDPARTAEVWRNEAVRLGIGDLYLARVDSFSGGYDPRTLGFDAAVEFAPNWRSLPPSFERTRLWRLEHRLRGFPNAGKVRTFDYPALMQKMLAEPAEAYPRFRCACPSWDNTPRRKENAVVFSGSSPELYERWLRQLIRTRQSIGAEKAPVFVNAWNEWAEGAHLEPCNVHGRAFLEATKRAIAG